MSTTVRIEKTKDFTVMSNYHLRDKSISLKAKGLLSQMLSLPEDWDYSINGLSAINKEGTDGIRAAVKELENAGYIVRKRLRDALGRVAQTEYIVYEKPLISGVEPKRENPTQENPTQENPTQENPTQENPTQEKPTQENPTQLNTNLINNLSNKNTNLINNLSNQSINQSNSQMDIDVMDRYNKTKELIKQNIRYDRIEVLDKSIAHKIGNTRMLALTDELVDLITEIAVFNTKPIKINNTLIPAELIKSVFLKLDNGDINYVLKSVKKAKDSGTKIRNKRAYLISALYNSKTTRHNDIGENLSLEILSEKWGL